MERITGAIYLDQGQTKDLKGGYMTNPDHLTIEIEPRMIMLTAVATALSTGVATALGTALATASFARSGDTSSTNDGDSSSTNDGDTSATSD